MNWSCCRNFSLPALCNLFATHLPSLTLLFVAVHLLALLVTPCSVHQSHTQTPPTHTHTLAHIKSIIKTFLTSHFHSWQLFSAHVLCYSPYANPIVCGFINRRKKGTVTFHVGRPAPQLTFRSPPSLSNSN